MTEATNKTIETSTAIINYHDVGTGPVVLALHGGGPGATGWGNFWSTVDELKGDFRLIVPDQPGFGLSTWKDTDDGTYFPLASARVMLELLSKLGVEKAHVIGNSAGGGVAMRMALEAPDAVDRLILMGAYFRGFPRTFMGPAPAGNAHLSEYYPEPTAEKMERMIRAFVFDASKFENLPEIVESRFKLTSDPKLAASYMRFLRSNPDPDPRSPWDMVSSIKHKAQIVWGKDDKFCHLEDAFQYLTALDNSELVVFRDTGHWVMLERPKEFASHVAAFLSR
ncbi:alpha/beta hydrolase [Sphingomonadaceae bacterium G21617-S1]|nr:alpha/beta hydrolase [Sphingomonadaceae bacterium G21617-S1]